MRCEGWEWDEANLFAAHATFPDAGPDFDAPSHRDLKFELESWLTRRSFDDSDPSSYEGSYLHLLHDHGRRESAIQKQRSSLGDEEKESEAGLRAAKETRDEYLLEMQDALARLRIIEDIAGRNGEDLLHDEPAGEVVVSTSTSTRPSRAGPSSPLVPEVAPAPRPRATELSRAGVSARVPAVMGVSATERF